MTKYFPSYDISSEDEDLPRNYLSPSDDQPQTQISRRIWEMIVQEALHMDANQTDKLRWEQLTHEKLYKIVHTLMNFPFEVIGK